MNKNKGFTLIELLVVIAIIGILASVVLASLNTAREKGKDASAKSSLTSVRAQAEIYYNGDGANSYGTAGAGTVTNKVAANLTGACNDEQTVNLLEAVSSQLPATEAVHCIVGLNGQSYIAYTTLNGQESPANFCVDSSGYSGELAAEPAAVDETADVSCQ